MRNEASIYDHVIHQPICLPNPKILFKSLDKSLPSFRESKILANLLERGIVHSVRKHTSAVKRGDQYSETT